MKSAARVAVYCIQWQAVVKLGAEQPFAAVQQGPLLMCVDEDVAGDGRRDGLRLSSATAGWGSPRSTLCRECNYLPVQGVLLIDYAKAF